jgi:hypothetical protein
MILFLFSYKYNFVMFLGKNEIRYLFVVTF